MLLSKSVMLGYDRHSTTERVWVIKYDLTNLDGLRYSLIHIGNYMGEMNIRRETA